MDMLCIAAQGDPLSAGDIARMTGGSLSEVETLMSELEQNGVFSRDRNNIIYSRRMVNDSKKAATARKNGKKGGNPSLRKESEIQASDKGKDKPPSLPPIPKPVKEKGELMLSKKENGFEDWWSLVPRKVAKGDARIAFKAALKRADLQTLRAGIMRYAAEIADSDPHYIAHPATWLRADRWLDDPMPKRVNASDKLSGFASVAAELESKL